MTLLVTSISQGHCAYCSTFPLSTRPPPHFPERASLSPPFCGFRFCERGSLPLIHNHIQFYGLVRRVESGTGKNPNILTILCQFSSDFGIDDRFGDNGLQMVWN
ncbi:hypothetical protein AVEN_203998-1 [Araneus ventricosus]|uniref:Uncharacterized protein n=1 Tax=Araneus ventricosus TaxID=182803 RepID=A0A4Y2JGW3_ARAVE|nr:hypothetical protein AVEN_203998-1 [Araneus ventricosus]